MSKSDVSKLYATYGDKMCLAPFVNSFYSTCGVVNPDQLVNNFVRPCSIIQTDARWDVQNSNITQTRNTPIWKDIRQQFLDGCMPDVCSTCNNAERAGSSSPRQLNNEYLFEHLDIDIMSEIQRILDSDLTADKVYTLDYMPSNYCNYACVMCYPGASSQRHTFSIKQGIKTKYKINPVDNDFFDVIKDVKILGFTGGETILQPEVNRLIDYLIENQLSQNMIITILTNASDFPDELVEKFKKFKRVLYTVSIDGVGDVIEYQRRGAQWTTIVENVSKIQSSPVHKIVNHVVTAINILSAMDFVDWCHANNLRYTNISHVFQEHLGIAALPPELKSRALGRLQAGRKRYEHYATPAYSNHEKIQYVQIIDRLISIVENVNYNPQALERFIKHIQLEDMVSKKPLREVVPEWAPWFN
jgi:sulfatase maturation enzyme AslB (radical SAM superfamily)